MPTFYMTTRTNQPRLRLKCHRNQTRSWTRQSRIWSRTSRPSTETTPTTTTMRRILEYTKRTIWMTMWWPTSSARIRTATRPISPAKLWVRARTTGIFSNTFNDHSYLLFLLNSADGDGGGHEINMKIKVLFASLAATPSGWQPGTPAKCAVSSACSSGSSPGW